MSKSDMPETNNASDQEAPKEPQAAPPPLPKNQLTRRVEARIAELEAALELLGDDPAKYKQIRSIRMALKGAHDSMTLTGERMSVMEAALATRWLESTQYLAGRTP